MRKTSPVTQILGRTALGRTASALPLMLLLIAACGDAPPPPPRPVAYRLKGTVKFNRTPLAGALTSQFGGNVHFVLYQHNDAGYCDLGEAAWKAYSPSHIVSPLPDALEGDGVDYVLDVIDSPPQTFPQRIYVQAVWQNTDDIEWSCQQEASGDPARYNARGGFGRTLDNYQSSLDCCGFAADGITVSEAGQTIEGVDILLVPERTPLAGCVDPQAPPTEVSRCQ